MPIKIKHTAFFVIIFIIAISGCHRRYWYREMVWSKAQNNVPVNINIVNQNPLALSKDYEKKILQTCEKQLLKKGYIATNKKAQFQYNLVLKVELYTVSGLAHYGGERTFLYPYYNKDVKAILFESTMLQNKKDLQWKVWENSNDLYFFNIPKRDMRRSKSMVKYLIRSAKTKS